MSDFTFENIITDKNKSLLNYQNGLLLRTNQIFHWNNLPVDQSRLEYTVQSLGKCYIIKHDESYYIVSGNYTGNQNIYGEYTQIEVNNPYNTDINGKYNIYSDDNKNISDNSCIEVKNNYLAITILELVAHYAILITECEITLRSYIINSRNIFTLVSGDNKAKKNCELFMKKLIDGDLTILSDNSFLESIKVLPSHVSGDLLYKLLETLQYLKASALHDVGINANYELKKSITTRAEHDLNLDYLIPLVDNMHRQRIKSCEYMNELFNLDVSCDLHSTWLAEKLKTENNIHNEDTEIILDSENTEHEINQHISETESNNEGLSE
jgi:hypothetical protein